MGEVRSRHRGRTRRRGARNLAATHQRGVSSRRRDVQRVVRAVRQRWRPERRRQRVRGERPVVVPVRQREVRWAPGVLDRLPDDPFEEVQVHPVPGQEEPALVLALVPLRARRRRCIAPVDRRLERPAGWIRGRPRLHRLDRLGEGERDRLERAPRLKRPRFAPDKSAPGHAVPLSAQAWRLRRTRHPTSVRLVVTIATVGELSSVGGVVATRGRKLQRPAIGWTPTDPWQTDLEAELGTG